MDKTHTHIDTRTYMQLPTLMHTYWRAHTHTRTIHGHRVDVLHKARHVLPGVVAAVCVRVIDNDGWVNGKFACLPEGHRLLRGTTVAQCAE